MHDIDQFFKDLLSEQPVNLYLYKERKFCKEMQMHALEKIKFLLLDILGSHLPHEHVGSKDPFFLSKGIHEKDHNGLNIIDYCILAGLDDIGCIFTKLGCESTIDVEKLHARINEKFSQYDDKPAIINAINQTLSDIELEKQKYKDNPLSRKPRIGGVDHPTLWQKIKYTIKNFPYSHHKLSILILLFGLACLIAAPFAAGLSTILLLSLGFPAMLTGLGDLQNAIAALNNYQQIEQNSRITHEDEMLRVMHKEICHQIKILSSTEQANTVSRHIMNNTQRVIGSAKTLLYFPSKSYRDKEEAPKRYRKKMKAAFKLEPPMDA